MRDNLYERTHHTFGHVTGNCEHCETGTEYYTGNFFTSVQTLRFGPCYMSLLHSPATCPLVWAHFKTMADASQR